MALIYRLLGVVILTFFLSGAVQAKIEFDGGEIEKWADLYFQNKLDKYLLTAAGISVVQGGKILFSKGYGHEDLTKKTPFDPQETRIRVCSNSKPIVATALMQLVEKGIIQKLSDPVNKYLKRFKLPDYEGKSVTILDILTHRGGFSLVAFNTGILKNIPTPVAGEIYETILPAFNVAPGEVSSYANAALAVQGAVIEDITGETLGDYLANNIFAPLGMNKSLYHHQMELPDRLALPFRFYPDGTREPVLFVPKHPVYAPSGGVISTVNDMARFMIAHADQGRTSRSPILKTETFQNMHRTQVKNHPALFGMGLQFFTETFNSEPMIQHGCGLGGFTTMFVIWPESNVGVFISVVAAAKNTSLWENITSTLMPSAENVKEGCCSGAAINVGNPYRAFMKNFLGKREEDMMLPLLAPKLRHTLSEYEGTYQSYRSFHGNVLSLFNSMFVKEVSIHQKGGLKIGGRGPYLEIQPDVFQHQTKPKGKYAFKRDEKGQVYQILSGAVVSEFKVNFLNNPKNATMALIVLGVLCLTSVTAFFWPKKNKSERIAAYLPLGIIVMMIIAGCGLLVGFDQHSHVVDMTEYLNVGHSGRIWILVISSNMIAFLGLMMVYFSYQSFKNQYWGNKSRAIFRRAHYLIITISAFAALIFLFSFKAVGFYIP